VHVPEVVRRVNLLRYSCMDVGDGTDRVKKLMHPHRFSSPVRPITHVHT